MYKLYSERMRNRSGEPEVYVYEHFPNAFRNQVFYIMADVLKRCSNNYEKLWDILFDRFAREKGVKLDIEEAEWGNYGELCFEKYIESSNCIDFLDMMDFVFHIIDDGFRKIQFKRDSELDVEEIVDKAIEKLNYRFRQHNLGYEFVNGEIIRIDNKVIHQEIVKPALRLLYEEGFDGAEEEYRKAFEYRRKGDNKNAILEAGKAFESTMKTICDKKGYTYDKAKDTAAKLINILESNNFYPSYMSSHLSNLRTTLETGLPVVRNKNAGHGQGSTVTPISDEFAEYALNLAATNIVLLVGIYKSNKKRTFNI